MLWLLIGYMYLFIHRPFEIWPSLGTFRMELVYMLITGSIWLVNSGKRWLPNPLHWANFFFAGAVLLTWLASSHSDAGQLTVENHFKILVFYVLLVTLVHDERTLRLVVQAMVVIMTLYMAHSVREYLNGRMEYRMGIYRLIGVDKSLGDPNSFAASIVYGLPLVIPFWMTKPSGLMRTFLMGFVGLSAGSIALTGSRSGLVGLLLAALVVILRSQYRWRMIGLAVVAAPLFWLALPPSLQTRFETIIDPSVGPANAQESAEGRIAGLQVGWKLFTSNPATGCGPGAWRKASGSPLESHNLYGQLAGEMGGVGIVAFLLVIGLYWHNNHCIAAAYHQHPEWERDFLYYLSQAMNLALLLLLFEGNFGHNLFRFTWLWYGGFTIIARHCVEQRLAHAAQAPEVVFDDSPAPWERSPYEWIGTPT